MSNDEGTITTTKPKKGAIARGFKRVKEPQKPGTFAVVLHNDDFTPMEFVVYVLETVFGKSLSEATKIMIHVHENGIGICGSYTYEVAETKVEAVHGLAEQYEYPLQATMEEN